MTHPSFRSLLTACALSTLSAALWAQNLAIVNGKAVPKARAEVLAEQLAKSGRPVTPELEAQSDQPRNLHARGCAPWLGRV